MYNFDITQNRKKSGSVKWDTGARIFGGGDNFIPMWIADTDFATLPQITQAIEKRISHPLFGYSTEPSEFFSSISQWQKENSFNINTDWVVPSDGVVNAISIAINAFTIEGDKIVVQTPCYDNFYKVIEQNKRVLSVNKLIFNGTTFSINFEDLENHFINGAKFMLFCNPHNPTGRVWTKAELEKLAELCLKYNIFIISDDIHCDVVFNGYKYTPLASINEKLLPNTMTCYSPGKTFNVPGLKASAVIFPNPDKRKAFKEYQERLFLLKLNVLSYEIFTAAYTYGSDYAKELREYIESNADYVVNYLEQNIPQIKAVKAEGTFLMLWDCTLLGLSGRELVMFFAKNAGVAFSGGSSYCPTLSAWVRVNLGCSRETLTKAMEQIKDAVNNKN